MRIRPLTRLAASATFVGALLAARIGHAHGGAHEHAPPALTPLWQSWNLDPWVLGPMVVAVILYARGARRLRDKASTTPGPRQRHAEWAFAGGILALVVALVSPLDRVSDVLFSAHMSQHELLMLVAAPLLVYARPWQAFLTAAPAPLRSAAVRAMRSASLLGAWRLVTTPLVALALHAVVRWAWHAPVLFQAALASEWVHGFQHFTFFATAALFWWALMEGRYGRLGYGVAVLFVFATAMHTGILGALLTFARNVWYRTHEARTQDHALDPLADQQLAGLIMWIPTGMLFLAIALALFAAWLGELARRDELARRT